VLSCIRANGQPAVLKIGFRHETIEREAAALAYWPARVPQVLGYDASRSALLLERIIEPIGRPQQASTAELAQILKELHRSEPLDDPLPTLKDSQLDNLRRIDPGALSEHGLSHSILSEAAALIDRLSATEGRVLLHGDVRPGNTLYDRDKGWILIDPDPQIGDPAYDAAFWALSTLGTGSLVARAKDVARAVHLDPERVLGWAWIAAIRQTYLRARVEARSARSLAGEVDRARFVAAETRATQPHGAESSRVTRELLAEHGIEALAVDDLHRADLSSIAWAGGPTHMSYVRKALERVVKGEVEYLVVRAPNGDPVAIGGIDYAAHPGTGALWQLSTHPDLRGLGLGTRLIKEAEERIKARGLSRAVVGVEDDNARARALYMRLGYRPWRRERASWQHEPAHGTSRIYTTELTLLEKDLT